MQPSGKTFDFMSKTDFSKKYKTYYTAKTKPELIELSPVVYLSVSGKGDPSGTDFAEKVQAMYGTAYAIKFDFKARTEDFVVPRLEALWWFDEEQYKNISASEAPVLIPRSEWMYRLLIRMPENIEQHHLDAAIEKVSRKVTMAGLQQVKLFELSEGKCVQILHNGPFDREPESLELMRAFTEKHRLERNGLHHEIYLSDFRKTDPSRLRTILREPVK